MARDDRRRRRDARRAAGEQAPQAPAPVLAGGSSPEATIVHPTGRRRGGFIRESWAELNKVDWPTRSQTIQGTIVVLIACIVVGAYLWGLDQVIQPFVRDVLLGS
jgi:preprotein translocase subunit SecE